MIRSSTGKNVVSFLYISRNLRNLCNLRNLRNLLRIIRFCNCLGQINVFKYIRI